MNRKLGRLIQPGMGMYFGIMLLFSAAALLLNHPWTAAAEAAVTASLFIFYQLSKAHRRRELEAYIQSATNTLGTTDGGKTPIPWCLRDWATAA